MYSFDSFQMVVPQLISEPMQDYIDGMQSTSGIVAGALNDMYIIYIGNVINKDKNINMTNCYLVYHVLDRKWLGAWDLPIAAQEMTYLVFTDENSVESNGLHIGDDDGTVWKIDEGGTDKKENINTGTPITLTIESQSIDISMEGDTTRGESRKSVKNMLIFIERSENVKFWYRFDSLGSRQNGWKELQKMRDPVTMVRLGRQRANLFQWRMTNIGKNTKPPILRKIVFEYD